MAIYKADVCNQFTQIPNETLQDETLSFEAKGLLVMILSLPHDWQIHKEWLQGQSPKCGRDKLTRLIKELTELGYMIKKPRRSDDGKTLAGQDWFVYPVKQVQPPAGKASSGILKTRRTEGQLSCKPTATNKHIKKETSSKSTVREFSSFSADQSEKFSDRVMAELLAINLPASKYRYAQLKIREFEERFPESQSVADCYSYVEQAVIHQYDITGR